MASNLTWLQAWALGTAATNAVAVRRIAEQEWFFCGPPAWFLWIPAGADPEVLRVVINTDFQAVDALATDWTDEPWTDPTTGVVGAYPPGFQNQVPTSANVPPATTLTFGTITNPPGSSAQNQIPPTPVAFGGGGGPSQEQPNTDITPQSPPAQPPVITVTVVPALTDDADFSTDSRGQCFIYAVWATAPASPCNVAVGVSIAGGVSGVGTLSVVLGGATRLGTAWKGMNTGYSFSGVNFTPGSQITATVTYVDAVGATHTQTGTFTFPNFCNPPTLIAVQSYTNGGYLAGATWTYNIWTPGFATGSLDSHQLSASVSGGTSTPVSMYPGTPATISITWAGTHTVGGTITFTYAYPTGNLTVTFPT